MSPLCSASCEFLCGVVGGLVAAAVLYPLEALEAHLHLDDRLAGKSAWQAAGAVYRTRGVSGFTIGMPVSVIGQGVNYGVYFFVSACVEALLTAPASQSIPMTFLSLVIAGAITTVIVNPFWLAKSRQVSRMINPHGAGGAPSVASILSNLYAERGISGLLTGVRASLFNTFEGAIQFTLFALLRRLYVPSVTRDFVAGAFARLGGVVSTYPSQVLRSRVQAAARGSDEATLTGAFSSITRRNGLRGLFTGLGANLPRQFVYGGLLSAAMQGCQLRWHKWAAPT